MRPETRSNTLIFITLANHFLLITPILFLLFASGCSKSLFNFDNGSNDTGLQVEEPVAGLETGAQEQLKPGKSDSPEKSMPGDGVTGSFSAEPLAEAQSIDKGESGSGLPIEDFSTDGDSRGYEKPEPRQFGSAEQGMPGDGATGSFSAEPFTGSSPEPGSELSKVEPGTGGELRGYEKPEPRQFGSAEQGMPGGGATGSFSAEPFTGSSPEPDSGLSKVEPGTGGELRGYEKPEPRQFGSAEQGMPGGGATGSFSAEPFISTDLEPASEFFREETMAPAGPPSRLYEKPEPRQFGSAEQGMPGDGTTGSFSAEPFIEESGVVAELPKEEQVRRQLTYGSSDNLQDIHFAFDKYDLTDSSRAILKKNASYLKAHPNTRIEIQGHCDERGSNNYNITLGERRVRATRAYLVSLGVDESRIHAISYGEERPFCFESNEECWYQNRRAHFLVAK